MRSPLLTIGVGCLLTLAATFASPAEVRAQACPDTDYTLTTQAEVDAFPNGCQSVTGNLYIQGGDITDLSPISLITSVGFDLEITGNYALTTLDGLSGITTVGGYLWLSSNAALTNLDGLSGITAVGALEVKYHDALTDINGLSALSSFVFSLVFEGNDALTSLDGLSGITSGGGNIDISAHQVLTSLAGLSGLSDITSIERINIRSNAALTSLDGLSGITSVAGEGLYVTDNTALTSLAGLSGITSIAAGDLEIRGNDALTNLDGLSGITSVGGWLGITFNDALTNLDGLSGITSVGGFLEISGHQALTSLDGLSGITSVGGDLVISNNSALTSLDGLSGITSAGVEGLYVTDNTALTSLAGLSGITSIGAGVAGNLDISSNDALTNLDGLAGITSAVGGVLSIGDNAALTNLDGLSGITSVGDFLYIWDNDALTSLDGLNAITTVGDNLYIEHNNALTSLDGLSGITSVDGELGIEDNGALTNLNGLAGLTAVGELKIERNQTLVECSQGLSALVKGGGVVGLITMNGNAASGDCNNDGADLVAVNARVQFVHASPDPAAALVDVYLDDVLWRDDFSYREATPFSDVRMGGHTISIAPSSSTSAAESFGTFDVSLEAGKGYHLVTAGVLDPAQFPTNPDGRNTAFNLYVDDTALESARDPATGFFDVRDFHAVLDFPAIDFSVDIPGQPIQTLWTGLAYGEFNDWYSGTTVRGIVVRAHPSGDPDSVLYAARLSLVRQDRLALFAVFTGVGEDGDVIGVVFRPDGSVLAGDVVTDVDDSPVGLPATFRLESNYPNPFNPSTTISYDLPRLAEATLTVYDVLGRTVRELASGTQPAGTYEVSFDATGLPSGIYFYRLKTEGFVNTKRMVVVK